jgi:hypothetical protein
MLGNQKEHNRALESWKEIAEHVGRDMGTASRPALPGSDLFLLITTTKDYQYRIIRKNHIKARFLKTKPIGPLESM